VIRLLKPEDENKKRKRCRQKSPQQGIFFAPMRQHSPRDGRNAKKTNDKDILGYAHVSPFRQLVIVGLGSHLTGYMPS